jgi:type III restriction enzyme
MPASATGSGSRPTMNRAALWGKRILLPVMDPYNPAGSSRFVDLYTSKDLLWTTRSDRCHVNLVVGDSEWEVGFCETIENALGDVVFAYVKKP